MKLLAPKLKWKKDDMDVFRVLDNWTLTHPSFEKHILPHEMFEKFLTTEEMERICLESNKYARYKSNHSFMMTIKRLKSFIAILVLSGFNQLPDKKCIGRGGRKTRTKWSRRQWQRMNLKKASSFFILLIMKAWTKLTDLSKLYLCLMP